MHALLIYPEFPFSFWSFTNILRVTSYKAFYYPLGLMTVAALLPQDWQVRLVDLNVKNLTADDWDWADMVMLSGMFIQKNGMIELIKEAKQKGKLTVSGGSFATLMPDRLIAAGCDYVVCGEAENTIDLLLKALAYGHARKIIRNEVKPDLTRSPLPRFDLVDLNDYRELLVQTTRGCPFSCEFCEIAALYGNRHRFKTPDQVINEIEQLFRSGAYGYLGFADDNFIGNRKNAKAICRELIKWNKKHGQPFCFATQVSVNLGQDLEMIDLMTAANFGEVFIGIETPDEATLISSNKHQNVTNPLLASLDIIKRNGLSIMGSFIIGFDNEKKGAGKRICDFVEQADIPIVMPNVLSAPPDTILWNRLKQENRLIEMPEAHSGDGTFNLPNFVPTRSVKEIITEYIDVWEYLYEPSRFFARTYRFCLAIRPTRRAMALAKGEKPPENPVKKIKVPLRRQLDDLKLFLDHLWTHGVLASYRRQFWKQLIGIRRQNPSRTIKYLTHCVRGGEFIQMSKMVRTKMEALLNDPNPAKPEPKKGAIQT